MVSRFLTAAALAAAATPVLAQSYVVVPLPLPPAPNDRFAPIGLTNADQVMLVAVGEDIETARRMIWLPTAAGDLPAGLNDIAGFSLYPEAFGNLTDRIATTGDLTALANRGGTSRAIWVEFSGTPDPVFEDVTGLPAGAISRCADLSEGLTSVMVGAAQNAGVARPFMASPGVELQWLTTPSGFAQARANGISSDASRVVGTGFYNGTDEAARQRVMDEFVSDSTQSRGIEWRNGTPIVLDALLSSSFSGWTILGARDVNNGHRIVARASDPNGNICAVLLVPSRGDYDGNGVLNSDDLGDYITDYFTENPPIRCDFDGDGAINSDDLGDFITSYFAEEMAGQPEYVRTYFDAVSDYLLVERLGFDPFDYPTRQPIASCDEFDECSWYRSPGCWGNYHPKFNPTCRGCPGRADHPNGYPGWPGGGVDAEGQTVPSPYKPCKNLNGCGPGGDGRVRFGDCATPGGPGGNGADGDENHDPGAGGDGGPSYRPDGYGSDPQPGGSGGKGGNGYGDRPGAPGGKGGEGGSGGTGGSGGPGGDGGTGAGPGDGGEGGKGGSGGGPGGVGGNGGGAVRPGDAGGSGGKGGEGGGTGGAGGAGGAGGQGGPGHAQNPHVDPGAGGPGGAGGSGGPGSTPGTPGGTGGNGGNGGAGGSPGGAGGAGGAPGDGGAPGPGDGVPPGAPGTPGQPGNPG